MKIPAKVRLRKLLKTNSITQLLYSATDVPDELQVSGKAIVLDGKSILLSPSHLKAVPPQYDDFVSVVGSKIRWSDKDTIESPQMADGFLGAR